MSNLGEYGLANAAWRMEVILRARANTYRVVLPARTVMPADPPTGVDPAVLVEEERGDAGDHRKIRPEAGPEQVDPAVWVVKPE